MNSSAGGSRELMLLQIDAAHPEALVFQLVYQVAADKPTCTVYQNLLCHLFWRGRPLPATTKSITTCGAGAASSEDYRTASKPSRQPSFSESNQEIPAPNHRVFDAALKCPGLTAPSTNAHGPSPKRSIRSVSHDPAFSG